MPYTNIKVLYEDEDILAIDKPSGIMVHADGRGSQPTITDWLLLHYPQTKEVGEMLGDIARPGIVHRIDKETSGVMLLAKTKKGHAFLKKQFQDKTIKKIYHCVVHGFVKKDKGKISQPIGRSPKDFRKRLAGRGARGAMREAITEYKVLNRFENQSEQYTYLEVYPKTGRTHQIRVHMKFLNHPLVADKLYGKTSNKIDLLPRLALHAKSIEFENLGGEKIHIESLLPAEFSRLLHN